MCFVHCNGLRVSKLNAAEIATG